MISWHFLDDFVEDIFGFSVNSSDDIYNHFYGGDTLEKSVRQGGVSFFAGFASMVLPPMKTFAAGITGAGGMYSIDTIKP